MFTIFHFDLVDKHEAKSILSMICVKKIKLNTDYYVMQSTSLYCYGDYELLFSLLFSDPESDSLYIH